MQDSRAKTDTLEEEVYQKVSDDWRVQMQANSRQRIVNKIMDTYKEHIPFSGDEELQELKKEAVKFEDKTYTAATSQSDYLQKISLDMLITEIKTQDPMSFAMQSNLAVNSVNSSDPGSQVNKQGQQLPTQTAVAAMLHNNLDPCQMLQPKSNMLRLQQLKQFKHRQMQHQFLQKKQVWQQQQQSAASGSQQVNKNSMLLQQLQHNAVFNMNSRRPTQGGSGTSGDYMESSNWRTQMTADSRKITVNKITDTLRMHLKLNEDERLQEVKSISERFEENVYTAATSQLDYLQKVSLILNMETSPQNHWPNA